MIERIHISIERLLNLSAIRLEGGSLTTDYLDLFIIGQTLGAACNIILRSKLCEGDEGTYSLGGISNALLYNLNLGYTITLACMREGNIGMALLPHGL